MNRFLALEMFQVSGYRVSRQRRNSCNLGMATISENVDQSSKRYRQTMIDPSPNLPPGVTSAQSGFKMRMFLLEKKATILNIKP